MAYKIERNIVVPDKYAQNASGFVAPFKQVHLHSTANTSVAYLSRNYPNSNYTHLVGESWRAIQIADVGQGAFGVAADYVKLTNTKFEYGVKTDFTIAPEDV